MSPLLILAIIFFLIGVGVAAAFGGLMVSVGIGDQPDHRSNHKKVTPTSGGLSVIATIGVMSLMIIPVIDAFQISGTFAQILSLVFAVGFLGLMDDILDLAALFKFFVLGIISVAAVWAVGPATHIPFGGTLYELPIWFSWGGSVLWIFVVMNIVNFMDGANGLMLSVMALASFFLCLIASIFEQSEIVIVLLMLTSACVGLLFYNFRSEAAIFSGDVGSLTIGFVFAVAVLWMNQETEMGDPIFVGPVLIMAFLADALLTMFIRAIEGKRLTEAHKEHLYQRMIAKGLSHKQVAYSYCFVTFVLGMLAIITVRTGYFHFTAFLVMPAAVMTSLYVFLKRKFS